MSLSSKFYIFLGRVERIKCINASHAIHTVVHPALFSHEIPGLLRVSVNSLCYLFLTGLVAIAQSQLVA